jgi:hypothetical protein
MPIKWYVEKGVFEENEPHLEEVLGDRLTYVKQNLGGSIDSLIVDMNDQPVSAPGVFYGSIQIARQLQKRGFFSFLPDNAFDYCNWLSRFGSLALNQSHLYLEAGCFRQMVHTLGLKEGQFFVKQEKGYKTLSGHVYNEPMTTLIERLLFPEELLVLAPLQKLGREFRFVIVDKDFDNRILTQSAYSYEDECRSDVPQSAIDFAQACLDATHYYPAQIWTLDICELGHEDSGQYRVVEPNSLLTSGWYKCDVAAIVAEVDRIYNEVASCFG